MWCAAAARAFHYTVNKIGSKRGRFYTIVSNKQISTCINFERGHRRCLYYKLIFVYFTLKIGILKYGSEICCFCNWFCWQCNNGWLSKFSQCSVPVWQPAVHCCLFKPGIHSNSALFSDIFIIYIINQNFNVFKQKENQFCCTLVCNSQ